MPIEIRLTTSSGTLEWRIRFPGWARSWQEARMLVAEEARRRGHALAWRRLQYLATERSSSFIWQTNVETSTVSNQSTTAARFRHWPNVDEFILPSGPWSQAELAELISEGRITNYHWVPVLLDPTTGREVADIRDDPTIYQLRKTSLISAR
ncbi:unnamed protein product [Protopolystoma xenopodis]|uniref:Uncharacterized protein n=1 Tax=Protopolystoma xenopodis TaxID=117903 RepID=A0A448WBF4_9PLAT|nr:unnamed protein product [Protopolystoma xenopodis]